MARQIRKIIVHHSERERDTFENIKRWQTTKDDPSTKRVVEGKGWSHVAYHFVIEPSGQIFRGADEKISAGGTMSSSADALEVCLCGDFDKEVPTPAALQRLQSLLTNWCKTCGLTPSDKTIVGHKELQPMKGGEINRCPGRNLLAQLPQLRRAVAAATNLVHSR